MEIRHKNADPGLKPVANGQRSVERGKGVTRGALPTLGKNLSRRLGAVRVLDHVDLAANPREVHRTVARMRRGNRPIKILSDFYTPEVAGELPVSLFTEVRYTQGACNHDRRMQALVRGAGHRAQPVA